MSLRIGLIGCGRIATYFHLPILRRLADAELVALVETDEERRAAASKGVPEAATFARLDDLLAAGVTDAIVICLPPALHAEAAIAALQAGQHVYVEKPLALNEEDAARVLQAAKASGRCAMVGFNFRYNPTFLQLRETLARGGLGQVVALRTSFCSARRALPAWKQRPETGGGALHDLAPHHLDLISFLLGSEIVSVAGQEHSYLVQGDTVQLQLEMANGVMADGFFSLSTGMSTNCVEVFGTGGRMEAKAAEARPGRLESDAGRHARLQRAYRAAMALDPRHLLRSPGHEPSFALALAAFVRAAVARVEPEASIRVGASSVMAVAAARRAIDEGTRQPVRLDELGVCESHEHNGP